MCDQEENENKETSSAYDIKGEENTSRMSEKKEKSRDGYINMYECGKHLLHSTYEGVCEAKDMKTSKTKYCGDIKL